MEYTCPREKIFFEEIAPKKFREIDFGKCTEIPTSFVEWGKQWAKNPVESIFLWGGFGCGKTTFSFALIREIFRVHRGAIWPRYYTSSEMDSMLLKASKTPDGDEYVIKTLASEDLLFIDDLGRESRTARLQRQYFDLINARYASEKPTIITSNYHLDDLSDLISGAIASRMQEWAALKFTGPDLRAGNKIIN